MMSKSVHRLTQLSTAACALSLVVGASLSCGAKTPLIQPEIFPLSAGPRQLLFVLDHSLSGFSPTQMHPNETSWERAVRMVTETAPLVDDNLVESGVLVFPKPFDSIYISCRVVDSMILPLRSRNFANVLAFLASQDHTSGASATYNALLRSRSLLTTDTNTPRVLVLYADGTPLCLQEYSRANCDCRTTPEQDCRYVGREPPTPGELTGCADTRRTSQQIRDIVSAGTSVFVTGTRTIPRLDDPREAMDFEQMAEASGTPGPTATHRYYRTDDDNEMRLLRERVITALSPTPCLWTSVGEIPDGTQNLRMQVNNGPTQLVARDQWEIIGPHSLRILNADLCRISPLGRTFSLSVTPVYQ